MWQKFGLTLALALHLFVIGLFQPRAIMLDLPFGLAYYAAEMFGYWRPGLMWVIEHRPLALFCFLAWPLLVSSLIGYAVAIVTLRLWRERGKWASLYAAVFVIAVFALILSVRADPGIFHISYFAHHAENY